MSRNPAELKQWPWTKWLFESRGASWIWLIVRLWLGIQWIIQGGGKIVGTEKGWMASDDSIKGYIAYAQTAATGDYPQVAYEWWVSILHVLDKLSPILAYAVPIGELLIGVGILLGGFTALAAFFGAMLNFCFVLSGTAGVNPMYVVLEVFLMLSWRNAGYIGADQLLLKWIGTPWQPGTLFKKPAVAD
ncbi:MAG: DoxX family protein [Candidatus Nanopelagicales bacterium]|nr:DoxX family protein [Candidatus Nanopelagicales bacterium]